jgi:hypothetical protein
VDLPADQSAFRSFHYFKLMDQRRGDGNVPAASNGTPRGSG